MRNCYQKGKCDKKSCFLCETFWKEANPAIRGIAITSVIVGACIIGILTACILTGVCLLLTQN